MKLTLNITLHALGRTFNDCLGQTFTLLVIFFMESAHLSVSIAIGILGFAAWAMLARTLVKNLQINTYGFWVG